MQLLFMYKHFRGWIETPALHPKRAYVYWLGTKLGEQNEIENKSNLHKIPIGTNPFN